MALNQGFTYKEQIGKRGAGRSVLDYLSGRYHHSSRAQWRERIDQGLILLDGSSVAPEELLRPGQWLVWCRPPWEEPDVPLCCGILHEDEELLAVSKPAGLPTLPAGGFLMHSLLSIVRKTYPEASPLHRLGRGTSGVVLFARTARALKTLHRAFRQYSVTKVYRALASGCPDRKEFAIDVPIGPVPHARLGTVHAASVSGRPASSQVRVLHSRNRCALLEVRIRTGRPHQIRIHLACAGHPLIGDPLYTIGGGLKDAGSVLPGETGYWLHAERVCLEHPATGLPLEIASFPPPQLQIANELTFQS